MRVLHVSDLHGRRSWFGWLSLAAPKFDLVCITGDLIDHEKDIPDVRKALSLLPGRVAICSGNHDLGLEWLLPIRRKEMWLDGDRFEISGVSFRCLPWGDPIPQGDEREVWLVHNPPNGTPTARIRFGIDFGDHEFGEVCRAGSGPSLALCGHVHEAVGWHARLGRTVILNPGFSASATRPNFNVVDFRKRAASRFVNGKAETVSLSGCPTASAGP